MEGYTAKWGCPRVPAAAGASPHKLALHAQPRRHRVALCPQRRRQHVGAGRQRRPLALDPLPKLIKALPLSAQRAGREGGLESGRQVTAGPPLRTPAHAGRQARAGRPEGGAVASAACCVQVILRRRPLLTSTASGRLSYTTCSRSSSGATSSAGNTVGTPFTCASRLERVWHQKGATREQDVQQAHPVCRKATRWHANQPATGELQGAINVFSTVH